MEITEPARKQAKIIFTSDQEPVECVGGYTERTGGFVLDFCVGENRYTVEHADPCTRFIAEGLLSYAIELSNERTQTEILSPFGRARFEVEAQKREFGPLPGGFELRCTYLLIDAAGGMTPRSINIKVTEQ